MQLRERKWIKFMVLLTGLVTVLAGCSNKAPEKNGYSVYTHGYDWGPGNSKIVVTLTDEVSEIDVDSVGVKATKSYTKYDFAAGTLSEVTETQPITLRGAYLSDVDGNKVDAKSFYITLELDVHPDNTFTNPYNYNFATGFNSNVGIEYEITVKNGDQEVVLTKDDQISVIVPETAVYEKEEFKHDDITLTYASYKPSNTDTKRPLVILLHGAGEGGTDPEVALLGNKVVALTSESIQKYFEGAFVLVPQTPTMWMNDGTGGYTTDGQSMYTESLLALIEDYIANNDDIDTSRVYIGGGSNGGYMTMKMLLAKPELFAAAFPICEAYASDWISDAELESIKNIPIWFVHSKDDTTVTFEPTALATYNRLVELGASDVRITAFDNVVDTTGEVKNAAGEPYQYFGHWSWIYVYNDEVKENGVSLYQWLADQSK